MPNGSLLVRIEEDLVDIIRCAQRIKFNIVIMGENGKFTKDDEIRFRNMATAIQRIESEMEDRP